MNVTFSPLRRAAVTMMLLLTGLATALPLATQAAPLTVRLAGQVPRATIARAHALGRVSAGESVSLALTLPLRDPDGLDDLLRRVYDPGDPAYGQFLSADEFAARFSPTPEDYNAVAAFARRQGLTVTGTHANRLLLDVAGPTSRVEAAFGLHLLRYRSRAGRLFRAPDADPRIPAALTGRLAGVVGLDTATVRKPHLRPALASRAGSGPGGGLTPADFQKIYSFLDIPATGAGQTLAVFELDGFTASDISAYEAAFGLPALIPEPILVDGATSAAGPNADEVTLDIEMALAAAPGLSHILVYETPNNGQDAAVLDCYNKIATDNRAKQVSTSWGEPENGAIPSLLNAEYAIFKQMAAQGQSIFAASGDNGAYDDGSTLSVDDPGSQPYVTSVGGTTLVNSAAGYVGESVWADPTDTSFSPLGSGSGGGFSQVWPTPDYQAGLLPAPPKRSVPDVSLNSDPSTGYSIYFAGGWHVFGGTSTAVPLWAGFTARVNQARAGQGLTPIGSINPAVYRIGASASYKADFHDVTFGSNLYYPARSGYDNATGWGSLIGDALEATLVNGLPAGQTGTVSGTVTGADTGAPLPGVTVTAASLAGGVLEATGATDAMGNYTLAVPSHLPLAITVSAYAATGGKYAGGSNTASVETGQVFPLPFALRPVHTFAPGVQMISAPYSYAGVGDFAALFGLTPPLSGASPRLIRWDPTLGSYLFYPDPAASTLEPGKSYWVAFPAPAYIHLDGVPVAAGQPFPVSLLPGWNQIADPFPTPAPVATLTVSGAPLGASPLVLPTIFHFGGAKYDGLNPAADALQPYDGYWIYAKQPATLIFPPPAGP